MRKKLPDNEKRIRVTITLDRLLNEKLNILVNNKSKYIEDLIINDLNK